MATSLFKLYLLSVKICLLSFGGIYSFWAIFNREAVVNCQDPAAMLGKSVAICRDDYNVALAFSEVLPGPQVNVASILGYATHGIAGMLAVLLGLLTPVVLISPVMYLVYKKYGSLGWVKHFFRGTGIAVIAILVVFWGAIVSRALPREATGMAAAAGLFALVFALSFKQRLHPMLAVLAGAVTGLFLLQ